MLAEADFLVTVTGATVVLMDIVFPDGSWVDALTMLARFHPFVAPLIMADPIDVPFVSEALNFGVFQILWKPVALDKLLHCIRLASEASGERAIWQRNHAGRNAHSVGGR
jgi:DNA-binding NtrC family response regulator